MKLYSLCILYKDTKPRMLKSAFDLQSFGYFQRGSVQEFMTFSSELLVERTPAGSKSRVKQEDYMCTIYVRSDSLAAVLISDQEYPDRVGFTLLHKISHHFDDEMSQLKSRRRLYQKALVIRKCSLGFTAPLASTVCIELLRLFQRAEGKVLDDFSNKVPISSWSSANPSNIDFSGLDEFLRKYQNPREADALTKIQADLDETKVILHNTIEAVLQRGEKLDDLVAKSEELSMSSKAFYTTARKTNQCCKAW